MYHQKINEIVFAVLYSKLYTNTELIESITTAIREYKATDLNTDSIIIMVNNITSNMVLLDSYIKNNSLNYNITRITLSELCILRMSIFEILKYKTTIQVLEQTTSKPLQIKRVIFEAKRLTSKFCSKGSSYFVRAILELCAVKILVNTSTDDIVLITHHNTQQTVIPACS